jgi:hypothetical protein
MGGFLVDAEKEAARKGPMDSTRSGSDKEAPREGKNCRSIRKNFNAMPIASAREAQRVAAGPTDTQ